MAVAAIGISHAPVMGSHDPCPVVLEEVKNAFDAARGLIASFEPDLVVVFAPDHYNGLFYDMMPAFCVATAATSVGDWRSSAGPVAVDRDAAARAARCLLDAGIDVAVSERLEVDHGFVQPLDVLFGGLQTVPVVPVFINCAAPPLGPMWRVRLLGSVLGEAMAALDRRVLMIGSGGLSHDPPLPKLAGATAAVAERMIAGRHPTADERRAREEMVVRTGAEFTAGTALIMPLNPQWDEQFLDLLAEQRIAEVDTWDNDAMVSAAGNASHEVRTWIAAYAALAMSGPYRMTSRYYRPIPEWIAGFAVTTAVVT